ncbi:MAG TPA: hypothetical protein VNG32_04195 [Candidatus Dormibacteraeota bacterium]|nr:hypothetical protein [Candidatus Dormibacteraeota bacterium]
MIQKIRRYFAAIILIGAPLLSLAAPGVAHASGGGTFTWSGGSGAGGNWSTPGNWVGGVAPQSGDVGDTVIIDNTQNFTSESIDNIATLSLTSLQFTNDSSGHVPVIVVLNDPLTVTGNITQAASDTATNNVITDNGLTETLTIGGNVAVTSSPGGLALGQSIADSIAITSGDTLSFADNGTGIVSILDNITNVSGSGTVTYNGAHTTYQLNGANTYTGTTNIQATGVAGVEVMDTNPFGTSTVNIANSSGLLNFYSGLSTLANTINVTGSSSTSPPAAIQFSATLSSGTFTLPGVVLAENSQFVNNASPSVTVDLTGITANGFCLEYSGANGTATDEATNTFTNGPTKCNPAPSNSGGGSSGSSGSSSSTTAAAPTSPDTGLAQVAAHPLETLAVSTVSAILILGIALRLKPTRR